MWTVFLCLPAEAFARERIVILAPAAADIVERLGASEDVVGVSTSIEEFPSAVRVGTHISPSIEVIASLKPTLILSTSRFSEDQAKRVKAMRHVYEAKSASEVTSEVERLGALLNRTDAAKSVIDEINQKLAQLKPLKQPPTALFEVRSNPLSLAGSDTVPSSALTLAGMINLLDTPRTSSVSPEYVVSARPDFYLYQEGPMNVNPSHPLKRTGWGGLDACVLKVDEKAFSRANTKIFDEILHLNIILNSNDPCAEGQKYGYAGD